MTSEPQDVVTVRVGGCVPYRVNKDGAVEVLMVCNSFEEDHWEFPKGKQEGSETDEETARRELKEETGLLGTLTDRSIPEVSYRHVRNGVTYHKVLKYFMCEVPADASVQIAEDELNGFVWLAPEQCVAQATHDSMKQVARSVVQVFRH